MYSAKKIFTDVLKHVGKQHKIDPKELILYIWGGVEKGSLKFFVVFDNEFLICKDTGSRRFNLKSLLGVVNYSIAKGFELDKKIPSILEVLSEKYKIEYKDTACKFTIDLLNRTEIEGRDCEGVLELYDTSQGMEKPIAEVDQSKIMDMLS